MVDKPKVFISYAHADEEFANKVLDFANKLRSEGIDANIDQYEECPPEGWPRWMENQIMNSDFVLIIFTKEYHDKAHQLNGYSGRGVSWEVNITYQKIYDGFSSNTKFIPVILEKDDAEYILTPLKSATIYNINDANNYENLYWRLRGINKRERPPLGKPRPLAPRERKTMYFSTCIDLDLWNNAKWQGMLYMFSEQSYPILCFVFENYEYGLKIFKQWQKEYQTSSIDSEIELTFVEAPFPKESNVERFENNGIGYFVHVGSNVDDVLKRMTSKSGNLSSEKLLFSSISRFHWMPEINGIRNRKLFQSEMTKFKKCLIAPIAIKDIRLPVDMQNVLFDESAKIEFSNVKFTQGIDLTISDNAVAVLGDKYNDSLLKNEFLNK